MHDPENGKEGDCWRACVASIFELPIEDVPHFVTLGDRNRTKEYIKFLYKRRWGIYSVTTENEDFPCITKDEHEYYFAIGPSPRFKNATHMVVCHKGEIVHDPAPDKQGVDSINYFEILFKL